MPVPESAARASLRRSMVIYGLLFALDVGVLSFLIASGVSGAGYVTIVVVGSVGLLLGYHVLQHVLDLGSALSETEGFVLRKWKRADLFIAWDSYYISIERSIFKLTAGDHLLLDEGMYVKVVHFPRTLHVVSVHEMRGTPHAPLPPPDLP